jgi:DNA-binding transcriptional MocR family regulator
VVTRADLERVRTAARQRAQAAVERLEVGRVTSAAGGFHVVLTLAEAEAILDRIADRAG